MLEDQSVLCFAPEPWHSMWRSRQQIMSRLAARNKVLFVEPRGYLRPVIRRLLRRDFGIDEIRRPALERVSDGLHIFRPPVLAPISERFPLDSVTEAVRNWQLRQAMKRLGFSAPILWLERPDVWDQMGKHGELVTVYRVTDEYTAFVGMSEEGARRAQRRERAILGKADLVVVASESLLSARKAYNANTHLLPHGVDYEAFAGTGREVPVPPDVVGLPRPIIGYSGLVSGRLDFALLRSVSLAFPRATLCIVGEVNSLCCESEIEDLGRQRNVVFLGRRPASEMPGYVNAFDVCLIPYRLNDESRNANPLKLLEYMAAGKPVVTVSIPAVQQYAAFVRIASDHGSFLEQVEMAMSEQDAEAVARRRGQAAAHSWDQVVERLGELIQAALDRKIGAVRESTVRSVTET